MGKVVDYNGMEVPVGTHEDRLIIIGADHRGFRYKRAVTEKLRSQYNVISIGTNSSERCDYPLISDELGRKISEDPLERVGIGICGSGIGMLIPASKHRGVYAARCLNPKEAETSRKHNNTNLLGIGADYMDLDTALETIYTWLTTPFYSDPEKEEAYFRRFVQTMELEAKASRIE